MKPYKKITRKEYNARKRFLALALLTVQEVLAEALRTNGENLENIDDWNEFHDHEDDLEQADRDLDHEWSTRNWTAAEWTSYSLMCQNID